MQAALQTEWFNEIFPLLPLEQGPGSPSTMPETHRMTPGKSLNPLPGFPHLPAGRGDSDSSQEPELSFKAVPALHLIPGFPPPNLRVWPHQGSLEFLHVTAGDACSEKHQYQKSLTKSNPVFKSKLFERTTYVLLKQSQASFPFIPATCLTHNVT